MCPWLFLGKLGWAPKVASEVQRILPGENISIELGITIRKKSFPYAENSF
jgi:hypothetical protein